MKSKSKARYTYEIKVAPQAGAPSMTGKPTVSIIAESGDEARVLLDKMGIFRDHALWFMSVTSV